MKIIEMKMSHYQDVLVLLRRTSGVSLRDADSRKAIRKYLKRNPGLSFVTKVEGKIIGCAMCGHDGRRGYLQHVVVDPHFRGKGIAHQLVTRCLDELQKIGILKTHIDVFKTNKLANVYWLRRGWMRRDDIHRYSFLRSKNKNA